VTPPLPPDHPDAPKYWMHETGGELRPAVERYLTNAEMTRRDRHLVILYLRQWVNSPTWDRNPHLGTNGNRDLMRLRYAAAAAMTRGDIDACTKLAVDLGMDPW